MNSAIPIVDLQNWQLKAVDESRLASAIDRAFRTVGFCYIQNTGVDEMQKQAAFQASRNFHALEQRAKDALAVNAFHRGYMAPKTSVIRTSSVTRVKRPNLSESFLVLHEVAPDEPRYGRPLQGPNQWPTHWPEFREHVQAYDAAMTGLARRFTRLLALALDLRREALDPFFEQPTTWLRMLRYPAQDASDSDQFGAAPHTDYGFITILAQDDIGGLEVRNKAGTWIPAPPLPGAFVVNVADMLARWTNDRWTSTPHRVRNLSGGDRYSIPFFWDPAMDSEIVCLPGCVEPGHMPRYEPICFGDYVMHRLDTNYDYRRQTQQPSSQA